MGKVRECWGMLLKKLKTRDANHRLEREHYWEKKGKTLSPGKCEHMGFLKQVAIEPSTGQIMKLPAPQRSNLWA